MTETDTTRRPLPMPEKFIPYMEKHRLYKLFKDMMTDLIVNLPQDHVKHMKIFLHKRLQTQRDTENVIILVSPELNLDVDKLVLGLVRDLGFSVITRRYILDLCEKHDDFVPGCVSPTLMSEVAKTLTLKDPIPLVGWLMFDHPCTVREARCLQQEGVLPTVTLALMPPPPQAPRTHDPLTSARSFFCQDFEGLKFAYKATLKEVHILSTDAEDAICNKCFHAIISSTVGAQSSNVGHHVVGAPGVYRVVIIGPRGSGRRTQAELLSKQFGLLYLRYKDLYEEAVVKKDELGEKLRTLGCSVQMKAEIVKRRILQKKKELHKPRIRERKSRRRLGALK